MALEKIEIKKEFGFDELEKRLRNVKLKGFQDVKIYGDSNISVQSFSPSMIYNDLFTPQPTVYKKDFLDRIDELQDMFIRKDIDIFNLDGGVDYVATEDNGTETEWTIIPPVVERVPIAFRFSNKVGNQVGLNYSGLLSDKLKKAMLKEGHSFNPELENLWFDEFDELDMVDKIPIICDGSHRIHFAYENEMNQKLVVIDGPTEGFPYYAAPQPYSKVDVETRRPEFGGQGKVHVLTEPGHKLLYRLFPTGGILSGTVRKDKNDKS